MTIISECRISAVILAGGLGTRLRGVVSDRPKPMAPVAGRPFLEWQIDYWMAQGVRHFVLSVGYRREAIEAHFSTFRGARIDYAVEEQPLGTGGGVLLALAHLDDNAPFLLLNGDTFFAVELAPLLDFHRDCAADWTLTLFRPEETGRYMGVGLSPERRIHALAVDDTDASSRWANGGVFLVEPQIFRRQAWRAGDRVSLEADIMPALLAADARFFGYPCAARFIDIGVPDDYRRAAQVLSG